MPVIIIKEQLRASGEQMVQDVNSSSLLESEISNWLVELIENDQLYANLTGKDDIERLSDITRQKYFIPAFTADYLSRKACAKAASHVLRQLSGLEIIAVNKSISLRTGEILKPDIIAFNPETRTIVVFEIKRDVLTERQAVTELMAYEQEVQNNFPFLSNLDLCFVVVARHWSTLMDHAVGGMITWSNKQCLAIQLDLQRDQMTLSCHLPSAWSLLGSFGVPEDALQSIDLTLYQSDNSADEYPPPMVITAAQMIARNGDRANSHGFLMLWRDHGGFKGVRWVITICALDPFVFFFHARRDSNPLTMRESDLSAFFESRAVDLATGLLPDSAMKIARDAIDLLRPDFSPEWEGFVSWHEKLQDHRQRAFPLYFEFWGKPGEYIRDFVAHQGVRNQLMPYVQANGLDWTAAEVAIPVIEDIAGHRPFRDGVVRCSDAFEVGEVLHLLLFLYENKDLHKDPNHPWHAFTRWAEMRALCFMIEMTQIYQSTDGLDVPPPPLSTRPDRRIKAAQALMDWVDNHLLGVENGIHRLCFNIGRYGALLLDPALSVLAESEHAEDHRTEAAEEIRVLLDQILARYQALRSEGSADTEQTEHYTNIRTRLLDNLEIDLIDEKSVQAALGSISANALIRNVKGVVLPAADMFFPVVFHKAIDLASIHIDWDWLKEGVREMVSAGVKRPAVTRDQSGQIGTGELIGPNYGLLADLSDPAVEVYFLDQMAGHAFAIKTTWDELMNGELLVPPPEPDAD